MTGTNPASLGMDYRQVNCVKCKVVSGAQWHAVLLPIFIIPIPKYLPALRPPKMPKVPEPHALASLVMALDVAGRAAGF